MLLIILLGLPGKFIYVLTLMQVDIGITSILITSVHLCFAALSIIVWHIIVFEIVGFNSID